MSDPDALREALAEALRGHQFTNENGKYGYLVVVDQPGQATDYHMATPSEFADAIHRALRVAAERREGRVSEHKHSWVGVSGGRMDIKCDRDHWHTEMDAPGFEVCRCGASQPQHPPTPCPRRAAVRDALAEALGPSAIEAATAIERGDYGEDPEPHDGALAHADAILAHPAMVAALDRSDPAAGLRGSIPWTPEHDHHRGWHEKCPSCWAARLWEAATPTASPTADEERE